MNILNMLYTLCFFSSKCSLFHNSNVFGSCIIHILYTECAKIKKKLFRRQTFKLLDTLTVRWLSVIHKPKFALAVFVMPKAVLYIQGSSSW